MFSLCLSGSRGAFSRSHTLELPDEVLQTGPHFPTGSLPRHCSAYTPPSPNRSTPLHNTPQLHHNTPQLHHNTPQLHHNTPQLHHNTPQMHHNTPLQHHNSPQGHHNLSNTSMSNQHDSSQLTRVSPSAQLLSAPHMSDVSSSTPQLPHSIEAAAASVAHIFTSHTLPHASCQQGSPRRSDVQQYPHLSNNSLRRNSPHVSYASVHGIPPLINVRSDSLDDQYQYGGRPHLAPVVVSSHSTWWPRLRVFAGVFVRTLLVVVCLLVSIGVCVLESKPTGLLHGLRSSPEMVLLRLQYYQPLKDMISSFITGREPIQA